MGKRSGAHRGAIARHLAFALGLGGLPLAAGAQDRWGPHLDVEAAPGSRRSLGELDLFLPVSQDASSLVFANVRARFDDHDGHEGNLGIGLRRMTESGFNLGGYGYFDRRRSETGNRFNQVTVGAEALGRDWDFRANGYVPVGEKARDLGPNGPSTATFTANTVVVSTAHTEERALKGFDGEVGWRAPVWPADADRQLRVYAGGYRFSDAGARVSGPRLRAELTLYALPALGPGAQLHLGASYQDDDARGSQGFVSLRLRIPFGGGTGTAAPAAGFQQRRMTAPVVRDVDVVTQTVVSPTRALVETAAVAANGQALTLIDSATTTGAALPGAVAAAGPNSTVVLTGTYNTTASTNLQAGQTLMGAGELVVRTPSGRTAVVATPGAAIQGDIPGFNATVNMAPGSTLSGLTVSHLNTSNSRAIAVRADGTSNVNIRNNTIAASTGGNAVAANGVLIHNGATNVVVDGNTIRVSTPNTVQNLVGVNASPGSGASVIVTGNTIEVTGTSGVRYGIGAAGGVPGGTILTASGNRLDVTGTGAASYAVDVINTAVSAGSTGNIRVSGDCRFRPGSSGTIGFTDGTSCP